MKPATFFHYCFAARINRTPNLNLSISIFNQELYYKQTNIAMLFFNR